MSDSSTPGFYVWLTGMFGVITVLISKLFDKKSKKEASIENKNKEVETKNKEIDFEIKEITRDDALIARLDKQITSLIKSNEIFAESNTKYLETIETLRKEKEAIIVEVHKKDLELQELRNELLFNSIKTPKND